MAEKKTKKTEAKPAPVSRKRDRSINRRKARNARRAAAKAKLAGLRALTRRARKLAFQETGVVVTASEARAQNAIDPIGGVWEVARGVARARRLAEVA